MNFFKKIGSIFSKMSPSKKATQVTEKIVQQQKIKPEPSVKDIEDLVNGTKSPYFSPIQTRNQRNTKTSALKTTLVKEPPKEVAPLTKTPKALEKTAEIKLIVENLKKLPENGVTSLEVLKNEAPTKPLKKKVQGKKKEKEDATVVVKPKKGTKTRKGEALLTATTEATPIEQTVESPPVVTQKSKRKSKHLEAEQTGRTVESPTAVVPKSKRKSNDSISEPHVKLEKWEPNQWGQVLEYIRQMRANVDAPVDTMGCHKCSDEKADEKTQRFHVLVALMLSSQTKDQVTFEAMKRLTESTCTPSVIADMDAQKLETLLYPVSFYKNKAKYLKSASKILIDRYDSDIPNNVKELVKLPGVGPKMAHICMSSAWNIVSGIGVDVHVHRISNRLGWVRNETKDPEQTRKALESWLPSDHWREVNYLLVGFGQTICTPKKPKCVECLNNTICPSAGAVKEAKISKKATEVV